jgi:hypothetical protein
VAAEKEEAVAGTGRHRVASTKGEAVRRFSGFSLRARENGAAAGWAQCRGMGVRSSERNLGVGPCGPCARMGLICALWV